jgi:hypothetical protein
LIKFSSLYIQAAEFGISFEMYHFIPQLIE